jgi:hypothetical protein
MRIRFGHLRGTEHIISNLENRAPSRALVFRAAGVTMETNNANYLGNDPCRLDDGRPSNGCLSRGGFIRRYSRRGSTICLRL